MKRLIVFLLGAMLAATTTTAAAGEDASPRATRRLGVMAIEITKELRVHLGAAADRGVLVGRVLPGTAAADAGIAVGDVVVEIDGAPVADAGDIRAALAARKAGDKVAVAVVRERAPRTLTITVRDERLGALELLGWWPWSLPLHERLHRPGAPDQSPRTSAAQ